MSFKKYLTEADKKKPVYSKMENCPFVYILVIPRLLKLGNEETKKDQILKNAIKVTEKSLEKLPKDILENIEKLIRPYPVVEIFKLNDDKRETFNNYFITLKKEICNCADTFIQAIEFDKILTDLYNCPEYEVFKNNI